jgi:PAS domain S-box-containing protein
VSGRRARTKRSSPTAEDRLKAVLDSGVGEALRVSEEKYRTLVDHLPAVTYRCAFGADGEWLFVSPQIESLLGYSPAEWSANPALWYSLLHPEDRERAMTEEARIRDTGERYVVEYRLQARNGRIVWVHDEAWPIRDATGRPFFLQGVLLDITERKRAEEALRESEARHQALVDYSFDGFIIVEAGVVREANRGFAQMLGYSLESVLGEPASAFVAPESRAEVARRIQTGAEGAFNTIGLRADGRRIHLETVAKMYMHGGRPLRLIALRDVTDRRQLEDQFRQAQKMEAVGRLAGGVAHDFNNLLTVITSYSQLLLDDLGVADPRRADLEEIRKAASGAATLTRQLLAFSRQQVLEPRVLDLNAVVTAAGKMLKRLIGEDVELATALAPDLDAIKADPGQLEQVIMNLAVNARDAMPMGGKLTIETANIELNGAYTQEHSVVTAGSYVLLAVSDTGLGMDELTRSRIFEPFFTTKEKGKGTGLGLATVYGIVKQSEGFVWVYSELGHGTTFKVYFPRVEERVDTAAPAGTAPGSLHGTETVLVAEDAGGVRAVVWQVLKRHGYAVLAAADGQSALDLALGREAPIDLLVTDVIMPEMSGRQLADRLRERRPRLKVLFVSGYTDDAIVRHGILEPGIAFLQKPFTPEALARKVREVLDKPV